MARKIFNQPPKEDNQGITTPPSPSRIAKLPGSVGGLRDSLREITANSIRDIDPSQIDVDGLRDRLILEDSSIDELAESISKHGQQVPIMVRPSSQTDRYQIVYGRRRLAAIRKSGGMVKAIVRTLDDDASLVAQGQENNLRLDPSFIEKSLFISEMQKFGYKPGVIQDALGLTRQGVSNHRVVMDQLPLEIVEIIGPAHGIGRRQWGELAAFSKKADIVEIAKNTLAELPKEMPSAEKFQAVYMACSSEVRVTRKPAHKKKTTAIKTSNGAAIGTIAFTEKTIAMKIIRKKNPEFSQWFEEHAEASLSKLFEQWQNENGSGK